MSTSRLWVGNLPKHITDERLKRHFQTKGTVTDVKIMKKDGVTRRFGFIGFRTPEEAERALNYFNKSFIDTSRLEIKMAQPIGDRNIDRPWSKHSHGSSAFEEKAKKLEAKKTGGKKSKKKETKEEVKDGKSGKKKQKNTNTLGGVEEDEKTKKELEAFKKISLRNKTHLWSDSGAPTESVEENVQFEDEDSDEEEYQDLFGTAPSPSRKESNDDDVDDDENVVMDTNDDEDGKEEDDAEEEEKSEKDEEEEDDNYEPEGEDGSEVEKETREKKNLRKRKPDDEEEEQGKAATKETEDDNKKKKTTTTTERLFIRNLPFTITEQEVRDLFSQYGQLTDIHVPISSSSSSSSSSSEGQINKGFAFVSFKESSSAMKAIKALDGQIFQGRLLHILPAKPAPVAAPPKDGKGQPLSFKDQRLLEKKKESTNEKTWNSLFLRSDTVAEAISERFGVSKADILNPSANNMAVRLALAESQIIQETKDYLDKMGVDMKVFEKATDKKTPRSTNIVIVKDLPYSTKETELLELFSPFGKIDRIVFPPSHGMSIIEFNQPIHAKKAFRKLAFSKFKHLPLYLEWAPLNLFKHKPPSTAKKEENQNNTEKENDDNDNDKKKKKKKTKEEAGEKAEEEVVGAIESRTLFVKNLNFETKEEDVLKLAKKMNPKYSASVRSMTISSKTLPDNSKRSRGFGFLEFSNRRAAEEALKSLQDVTLDGHSLQLQFSQTKKKTTAENPSDDVPSKKLMVRNLPFQVGKKELQELFSSYGHIATIRMPKKFDNSFRGFAFIEYLTKQEAKTAYDSLRNTHLYGRHIVIEFAKDDRSVDAIKEKHADFLEGLAKS